MAVEPQRRARAHEAPHDRPRRAAGHRDVDDLGVEAGVLDEVDERGDALGIGVSRRVLGRNPDQAARGRDEVGAARGDPGADAGCCRRGHAWPMAIGWPPRGVSETARANTIQRCEAEYSGWHAERTSRS